jgi:hypothetical protein
MADLSKHLRRQLRELADRAHEAELRQALMSLSEHFDRWKAGERTSYELSNLMHAFHNGAARELYSRYTSGMLEMVVAGAIARGVLARDEIAPEALAALERHLSFYTSGDS